MAELVEDCVKTQMIPTDLQKEMSKLLTLTETRAKPKTIRERAKSLRLKIEQAPKLQGPSINNVVAAIKKIEKQKYPPKDQHHIILNGCAQFLNPFNFEEKCKSLISQAKSRLGESAYLERQLKSAIEMYKTFYENTMETKEIIQVSLRIEVMTNIERMIERPS